MGTDWRDVNVALPSGDRPSHVLITAAAPDGTRYVSACSYLPAYGGFRHYHDRVTHWMPLPALPEDP